MGRPTIADVARVAGVSKSTVSRVLNGSEPHIRPETEARVRQAIATLDYRPSQVARSLALKRSQTLGLLISDISDPFYAEIILGMESVAVAHGYDLFLCNTMYETARGMRFVSSLIDKQVDGVLIVTTSLEDVFVEELMHHQIPFVALDWPGPEGFELTPDKTSFYPKGGEPKGYVGFDIPGLVPLFTEPGDEIIFADRTYHSAFPNQSDQVRLSCAIGFRARSAHIDAPWPRSPLAQHFVDALPAHLQPLVENYVGIDPQWRRAAMVG